MSFDAPAYISDHNGNGVAYSKFITIYNEIIGYNTTPPEQEPDTGGVDTEV